MPEPNFFIAGAPKAGTTSLYGYLNAHPDVYMSPRKEPQFFGSDLTRQPRHDYQFLKDEHQYLALFDGARSQKRLGEASTSYFYSERAAAEIKAFNPDALIIIMLRPPVDLMYSLYYQQLFLGYEDQPTFEQALAVEPERRAGRSAAGLPLVEASCYRYIAQLSQHVSRFFEVFGRDAVQVIIFDDFKADTAASYRRVLTFLDIDPDFAPDFKVANPNKEPRSTAVRDFLQNPPQVVIAAGRMVLPVARPVYRWLREANMRYTERAPLDPDLRRQLQAEFAPEVERLSELLGRDLSHWSQL